MWAHTPQDTLAVVRDLSRMGNRRAAGSVSTRCWCLLISVATLMVITGVLSTVYVMVAEADPVAPPFPFAAPEYGPNDAGKAADSRVSPPPTPPPFRRSLFSLTTDVIDVADTGFARLQRPTRESGACPWLVMFYSDGCGHCRFTAPHYATFANEMQTRRQGTDGAHTASNALQSVQVAALNCLEYMTPCRQHRIHGVPTVLLFLPPVPSTDWSAYGRTAGAEGEAATASVSVRDGAYTKTEMDSSLTGIRTMAEQVQKALDNYAASLPGGALPMAMVERCTHLHQQLRSLKADRLRRGLDAAVALSSNAQKLAAAASASSGAERRHASAAVASGSSFTEYREVHPTDIANAFFFTMFHEVAMVGFDTVAQRTALIDFLRVVNEALPGLRADVLLRYINDRVQASEVVAEAQTEGHPGDTTDGAKARRDTQLSGAPPVSVTATAGGFRTNVTEWQHAVLSAAIPFEGTVRELAWRTCRGSSWQYRGFPCGMWLLYHSLTANYRGVESTMSLSAAVDANVNPSVAATDASIGSGGLEVLLVILNYARYYFACDACRRHFLQFSPQPGPTSRTSAVLQLWRVHNVASVNLARVTDGADPLVPKRIFPDPALCPQCTLQPSSEFEGETLRVWSDAQLGDEKDVAAVTTTVIFNETAVAAFLLARYRWDPTRLRDHSTPFPSTTDVSTATDAAGAAGRETITIQRDPLSWNVFLTMAAIVLFVGLGCRRALRVDGANSAGWGRRRKGSNGSATDVHRAGFGSGTRRR